jgi:hypothetical protein
MSDFQKIALQQTMKSINEPVYCRICGRDLKQPYGDTHKSSEEFHGNKDMEIQYRRHMRDCSGWNKK